MSQIIPLTPREALVMRFLWNRGELTTPELHELYQEHEGEEVPYTTVLSICQKLRDDRWIVPFQDGRAYRWQPTTTQDEAIYDAVVRVAECLAGGDVPRVVQSVGSEVVDDWAAGVP